MLVNSRLILNKADKGRYAIGAFNVSNLEIMQAVIEGASELRSPVIVQTSESAIKYAGMQNLVAMTRNLSGTAKIPVALHLDHGKTIETIKKAIESGYTSVMIDASDQPFEKNAAITKRIALLAHKKEVSVEGELGTLGGKEDYVSGRAELTDPGMAKEFVEKTGVDCLAVAIGTSHGAFKAAARLDIKRLKKIKKLVKIPLALHGASGVYRDIVAKAEKYGAKLESAKGNSDTEIQVSIAAGVSKVNTDTDLRLSFTAGLRKCLKEKTNLFDPREIMKEAKNEMKRMVKRRIILFGSSNKC